jgi:hypothetical protein
MLCYYCISYFQKACCNKVACAVWDIPLSLPKGKVDPAIQFAPLETFYVDDMLTFIKDYLKVSNVTVLSYRTKIYKEY